MDITYHIEKSHENYAELESVYRQHYAELVAELAKKGVDSPPYNPRLDRFFAMSQEGWLIHYVARCEGVAVGYCNVNLSNDMFNKQFIANETGLFVLKAFRGVAGKRLLSFAIDDLQRRGVTSFNVFARIDPRAAKLWGRMGFKNTAQAMTYFF